MDNEQATGEEINYSSEQISKEEQMAVPAKSVIRYKINARRKSNRDEIKLIRLKKNSYIKK